jgi:hypothetical protein
MTSLQFMAWIGSKFGPSNLWHQPNGLRMNRLRDQARSIAMRAVPTARMIGQFWRGICNLSFALIACEKRAALVEAQRPSRGPFLRRSVPSHEAAREQHRELTANSRQNAILQ